MSKITKLFAPWILVFTFAAVALAFYGARAAPPMPDAGVLDVNEAVDTITAAARGVEHAESTTAQHMAIAALLAVIFRVLVQVGKKVLDVAPQSKVAIPWICAVLGTLSAICAHYAAGSSWINAIIVGAAGPGTVVLHELLNVIGRKEPAGGLLLDVGKAGTLCVVLGGAISCAPFYQQPVALQKAERATLGCAVKGVQAQLVGITPDVLDALAGADIDWSKQLDALAANGAQALLCAVGHALFDALGTDGAAALASNEPIEPLVERRMLFADASPDGVKLTKPTRKVLSRGLSYLRAHGLGHRTTYSEAPK